MNFLEMCNEVLMRMREDQMGTVVGTHDNIVHDLVKTTVNDARRLVEDTYDWTNLVKSQWVQTGNMQTSIATLPPTPINVENYQPMDKASVAGVGQGGKILSVWDNGRAVKMIPRQEMARIKSQSPNFWIAGPQRQEWPIGDPVYWTLNRVIDASVGIVNRAPGDTFEIQFHPFQLTVGSLEVHFKAATTDMKMDGDSFEVPTQPIMYYALAMLARERGEVGGQTSSDLFGIAKQYLNDAIALDSQNHNIELNWSVV